MNDPKWYCLDMYTGHAMLCDDEQDAVEYAAWVNKVQPNPHRAVQLVDAAELEAANKRIAELEALFEPLAWATGRFTCHPADAKVVVDGAIQILDELYARVNLPKEGE